MEDRLVHLLKYFELRARVFQAGPVCQTTRFDDDGLGILHILRRGAVTLRSPGHDDIELDEPALALYLSPAAHEVCPVADDTEMICASFELGAVGGNPLAAALPDAHWVRLADCPGMQAAVDLLFNEAEVQHCGRQAVLDRMMEVVFVMTLRELMDQHRVEAGVLAGLSDPRLAKALNAMHANPARAWNLEDMADEAGMSRARFAVHFREVVGTTPGAYLAGWRLMAAQSLLRRGKPLGLVADRVGYASASALARVFKEKTGESPGRWARRQEQAVS